MSAERFPASHVVTHVSAREGLSQLHPFSIEFASDIPALDLVSLLWKPARVTISDDDDEGGNDSRHFWGVVEHASYLNSRGGRFYYRIELYPRLHKLHYRTRSRIFQDQSVPEIITQVLKDAAIPNDYATWKTKGVYAKREYCVQYQESDLNFVLRLMEDEGIFFWCEHDDAGAHLFFGDTPDVHVAIDEPVALPFTTLRHEDREGVGDLVFTTRVRPDAHHARDWNWQTPDAPVDVGQGASAGSGLEWYEYPGGFSDGYDGSRRSRNRLQALARDRFSLSGTSTSRRLLPGRRFEIANAEPSFLSQEVLVVEVEHVFREHVKAAFESAQASRYECAFQSIPANTPFRPSRQTPKPRVFGKETAIIAGPKGEEIWVDEFGRVKVLFYWDRTGKDDGSATCWIRVQQQNTSGSLVLPRVGWEVDVGFIDGDPDRPIVLQKLYNLSTMPAYGLPASKSLASAQSATSPGGGSFNEWCTDDTTGKMNFGFTASRDLIIEVGADMAETVTVNVKDKVGKDLTTAVTVNETITIGANQSMTVLSNRMEEVVGSRTITVGAMDHLGAAKNVSTLVDGTRGETIGAAMTALANHVTETYQAAYTRTVGAAQAVTSVGSHIEAVSGSKTELVGGLKMELVKGGKVETIGDAKSLTAGTIKRAVKSNMSTKSEGAMIITVGGPWAEKVGENYTLAAKTISILAAGQAALKGGSATFKMTPGGLKAKGAKMGSTGMAILKIKGNIEYK